MKNTLITRLPVIPIIEEDFPKKPIEVVMVTAPGDSMLVKEKEIQIQGYPITKYPLGKDEYGRRLFLL